MENNSLFEDVQHQYFNFLFFNVTFFDMYMLFYFFTFGCAGSLLLHVGFSLVVASRGCFPVAVRWLLTARAAASVVASSVPEYGL